MVWKPKFQPNQQKHNPTEPKKWIKMIRKKVRTLCSWRECSHHQTQPAVCRIHGAMVVPEWESVVFFRSGNSGFISWWRSPMNFGQCTLGLTHSQADKLPDPRLAIAGQKVNEVRKKQARANNSRKTPCNDCTTHRQPERTDLRRSLKSF